MQDEKHAYLPKINLRWRLREESQNIYFFFFQLPAAMHCSQAIQSKMGPSHRPIILVTTLLEVIVGMIFREEERKEFR